MRESYVKEDKGDRVSGRYEIFWHLLYLCLIPLSDRMRPRPDKKQRPSASRRKRGHSSGPRRSSLPAPTQSFAPPPTPSRATINLDLGKHKPPFYKYYLFGFLAAFLLAFLNGRSGGLAWGFALIFSGLAAVLKPPRVGLGKWGDLAILGFLAALLLSFLPLVYWPQPDWRIIATDSIGIELPAVLSVQPWASFEAYFCVLAGVVWFYSAMQWRINYGGRRRLLCALSIVLALWAGWVTSKYFMGVYQVGGGDGAQAFFTGGTQRAAFFALGGIATFAYAAEGFRHRVAMPLFGLPATFLCLAALYIGEARGGLAIYYLGVLLWFVWSLSVGGLPRLLKWGLPLLALILVGAAWVSERSVAGVLSVFRLDLAAATGVEHGVAGDSLGLFLESPVGGAGLGSFAAVFPHYRDASASHLFIERPGSDFLRLLTEGGLLAIVFLAIVLFVYLRRCRGFSQGGSASYRRLAFVPALAFLGLCFVNATAQEPGTLFFGLLFAVLVLPTGMQKEAILRPFIWRIVGILLVCVGLAWIVAGSLGWPFHSETHYARLQTKLASPTLENSHGEALELVEDWLEARPLDWRAYTERARRTLLLGGDVNEAAIDFERARFVEPWSGQVAFEEGLAWLDRDVGRAIAAWEIALSRKLADEDAVFAKMLAYSERSPNILNGLARISEAAPNYRAALLTHLKGGDLMRELRLELEEDPGLSRFNQQARSEIVENWIQHGEFDAVQGFLSEHSDKLENAWWLQSLVYQNQAAFRLAVDSIRQSVEVPAVTAEPVEADSLARVARQFAVQPNDAAKGFALLAAYLQEKDYNQALSVIDSMLEAAEPDLSLHYWKAESLYQLDEYIESWYAFEEYLGLKWGRTVEAPE